jgi:hypothetical protein
MAPYLTRNQTVLRSCRAALTCTVLVSASASLWSQGTRVESTARTFSRIEQKPAPRIEPLIGNAIAKVETPQTALQMGARTLPIVRVPDP